MSSRLPGLLASVLLLGACTAESRVEPAWTAVAPDALSADQQVQLARATQARDALFGALGGKLRSALEEGTPVAAISVCKEAAPQIAAEVSAARGVTIGRTSQRLRNPDNAPPAWALDYVAGSAEEQACFAGPGGELGVLLPIRTMSLCETCHGPLGSIDPAVAEAIGVSYPSDRAFDYHDGDLRGWFWVEVGS